MIGGATDAGWSCRDHAWVTALLARLLGHQPALFHGEAFFAVGQNGRSAGASVRQAPHSWIVIEDVGAIDLSTRPDSNVSGVDFPLPITCIFANAWIPHGRGKAFFLDDPGAFARITQDVPQRRKQASAVYLINEAEHLHTGQLTRAAGWIRSPLAHRLGSLYGDPSDLYAALMLHLHAFLEGSAPSLSGLPFEEAWSRLAGTRHGAIERACLRFEAAAEPGHSLPAQVVGEHA